MRTLLSEEDSAMTVKELSIDLAVRYGFQVLGALVIVVAGVIIARWAGNMVGRKLAKTTLEPPVRTLAVRAVRLVVILFTILVALDKFGFQIAPLVAGIGVAGLGIGFALQGVLSNLVAGLSIIITKPFRVGEHVAMVGVRGDVSQIELFSTTLLHPDRSRVIIPNRKIVGEILHNYGRIRQLDVTVRIGARSNLTDVLAAAREVVAADPRLLTDPAPVVGVEGVTDAAITLAVQPWVAVGDYADARAALFQALIERFRARNIEIPLPQREVRLLAS
jgi:small conductance mechanosensitive channel